MTHRLQPVAKRVAHKCRVVIGVVMRAQPWRAVVFAAMRQRGGMKGAHLGVAGGLEAPVPARVGAERGGAGAHGEVAVAGLAALAALAVADGVGVVVHHHRAQCVEDGVVKRPGAGQVGHAERDVVKQLHGGLLSDQPGWARLTQLAG